MVKSKVKRDVKSNLEKVDSSQKKMLSLSLSSRYIYAIIFVLFYIFSTCIYGDVFARAEQDSFIASDDELMKQLTDQQYGWLYCYSRWMLVSFKNIWIGGLLLSTLLTLSTYFLDKAFRLSKCWIGLSSIFSFGILFWVLWRGTSLYYKNEPSLFLLFSGILCLFSIVLWISSRLIIKKRPSESELKLPIGLFIAIALSASLYGSALYWNQNEILTARIQNRLLQDDFEGITSDVLSAKRPSRSIAAYYAIALQQNDNLLNHLFDISFNFPEVRLDQKDGVEEYGIFLADCNFYAGLINASYRNCMDHLVMNGARLYTLKRMVLCCLLNNNIDLAIKYLHIISKSPFEQTFVEKYQAMADNPSLINQDFAFASIKKITPLEQKFEQNYRSPAFLGYNVGMLRGNNEALNPSIAACLYSKDLPNAVERAAQLKIQNKPLPMSVQEAISIHGRKRPEIFNFFKELALDNKSLMNNGTKNVDEFFRTIQNYYINKFNNDNMWKQQMVEDLKNGIPSELKNHLKKDWLGHYVYYYYCENITPKKETTTQNHGVN